MEYGLIPKIDQAAQNNQLLVQQVQPSNEIAKLKEGNEPKEVIREEFLKAKESDLLESTASTRNQVLQKGAKHLMIFECVSRLEYLTVNSYSKQLRELNKCESIKSVFGVISIGEVANSGEKYIDLLNKSCVIGGICH